jgi:hypothetical protein
VVRSRPLPGGWLNEFFASRTQNRSALAIRTFRRGTQPDIGVASTPPPVPPPPGVKFGAKGTIPPERHIFSKRARKGAVPATQSPVAVIDWMAWRIDAPRVGWSDSTRISVFSNQATRP